MDTEDRLLKLEEFAVSVRDRLARIETRLELMATKADLAELRTELKTMMLELHATTIRWIIGMVAGLGVAGITVMTFVLNNAVPKQPPAAPPAPIVIQVPTPAAIPAAPSSKP